MPADFEIEDLPYRQLVEEAPDGKIVCDEAGRILFANKQAEQMFGYTRDELVGSPIELLVPDRVRGRHHEHVSGFTAAPRRRPMGSGLDLTARRKDRSELPVEISLSPIRTGRGLLVTANIRDVTEHRLLERELKSAYGYLSSAVDATQDAFVLCDQHDRIVSVNSSGRALFGSAIATSIVGQAFDDVLRSAIASGVFDLSNESRDQLFDRWHRYYHQASGTLEAQTGTGRYLRVTTRRTAEHGTVSVIADVTDDVQHAEELRRARETAEQASAAKSEFLSSMSHELRTPLNAILGFAQLLERDRKRPLDERQLERLGHVLRGGEHLLRLIDDVLDLSRIEAGRISISCEPVGIAEVIREVLTTLEPMAARSEVQLIPPALPALLPAVIADRTRLAQILMNFGSNAIKYGKQGGHVELRVTVHGARLRIMVVDDGIGIPAEKRAKIFEPFQRAGQEAGPIEGTGIGLTISKRLAELMRGTVGFTSEVGRGSQFWIELPVHRQAAAETAAPVPAVAMPASLATGAARHKVVYIEDNPSNLAFMRDLLEDLSDVELFTAPTAEIGIELVRAHRPSVVIMDINLPGMSGLEAVKVLHETPETRDIPVIGLSAAALVRDTARAKDAGFYRYLTKPVKVAELTAVLEELLVSRGS